MAIKKLPPDDLADLRPVLFRIVMRLLVGPLGQGMPSHLARNAVRLSDQAVTEYKEGYRELRRFVVNSQMDGFISAQCKFENAVIALHRALGYFRALRGQGLRLRDGSFLIPRPYDCHLLSDTVFKQLADLRNAIVHLDERLSKATRPIGEPIALDIQDYCLKLDKSKITWSQLTRYLRQANQLAARLGLDLGPSCQRP